MIRVNWGYISLFNYYIYTYISNIDIYIYKRYNHVKCVI